MTENFQALPRWNARLEARSNTGFNSLAKLVYDHYRTYEALEKFIGPYNARQRSSEFPYSAPKKDVLESVVKQGQMNYFSYQALLNNTIKFCDDTKGMKGLPAPHPATIHSLQLPAAAFKITESGDGDKIITVDGCNDKLIVKGLIAPSEMRFIIARPKLARSGMPSSTEWEVLFFKYPHGYIPDWVDSSINPRWVGTFH